MAIFSYNNVKISALNACVPKRIVDNRCFSDFFSSEEVEKVIKMTGIEFRRQADPSMIASDFAFISAKALLEENGISPDEIDVLIFCSLTPDYRMPATSFILQDRLGMKKELLCFDLTIGCSGYVYALNMAYSILNSTNLSKALVLNAHIAVNVNPRTDKATSLLFGDGATATLVEKVREVKGSESSSFFSLNSDGSGYDAIIKRGGGYRCPTTEKTLERRLREDGSMRSDEDPEMDGPRVFDFTITKVPKDIKHIIESAGMSVEDIPYFVFHQANLFIIKHISKKLKIPFEKVPLSLSKFGNLSSASLPLTIVSEMRGDFPQSTPVLLTAFGVGLSWASAIVDLKDVRIGKLLEV